MTFSCGIYFGISDTQPAGFRAEDLVSVSPHKGAQVHFVGLQHIGPGVGRAGKNSTEQDQNRYEGLFHSLVTFRMR